MKRCELLEEILKLEYRIELIRDITQRSITTNKLLKADSIERIDDFANLELTLEE